MQFRAYPEKNRVSSIDLPTDLSTAIESIAYEFDFWLFTARTASKAMRAKCSALSERILLDIEVLATFKTVSEDCSLLELEMKIIINCIKRNFKIVLLNNQRPY